jgi:hypothetical protein
MPFSYRRALEKGIRASTQTRQKNHPMDVHVHVTILRLHSEYLARLFTAVSAQLGTLEQTLSEGAALTAAETGGLLAAVAALQTRLCAEGEMFCHRLHTFVEESRTAQETPEPLKQQTATEAGRVRKSAVVVR